MILLRSADGGSPTSRLAVAVFGAGLVGSAVVEVLVRLGHLRASVYPFDWEAGVRGEEQLKTIDDAITGILVHGGSLSFLWSAGRAGFGATVEETSAELERFRTVLRMAELCAHRFPASCPSFHLVSSAGGLFEGQRCIGPDSVPQPRRQYGWMKLRQEGLLQASVFLNYQIYRLSSVYGYLRPGRRWGLITTLLVNGVHQRASFLTGRMSTLRDFVFVGDVASCIAPRILADDGRPSCETTLLASGRSCSLFEVQRMLEDVIGRKVFVAYSLDPANSSDITFSPSAVFPGWYPCDLRTGLLRVYRDALSSGALFSAAPQWRL